MLKRLSIVAAIATLLFSPLCAQTISVGIVSPEPDQYIDATAAKAIVTKLQRVLAQNGVADSGSDFVLVPTVTIDEDDLIESGMVNIFKLKGTLNITLTQLSTGKTFGATSTTIKGSGKRNKAIAVKAAAGSLNVNDPTLHKFLEDAKNKVVDYYTQNASSLLAKARTAAAQDDYEQALAILASFPDGLPMEAQINEEVAKTYKKYLNRNCQSALIQAKSALATKNYALCNAILADIDPSSSCYSEALAMTQKISAEVRQAEAQERADQKRREQNALDLAKTRINAARDVAKAYYQRTHPSYTVVFR